MSHRTMLLSAALLALVAVPALAAGDLTAGMQKGTPELKSAGPATFAPQGILLVGDTQGATIFAIATGDKSSGTPGQPLAVDNVDEKVASLLGTDTKQIIINDLAVNPETGNVFLTVSRGKGADAKAVIVRIDAAGQVSEFPLKDVSFSKASIPNPGRTAVEVTTDLQFSDGKVIVAGLSNEEFASNLRVIPFPFENVDKGASVEIWHGAHGQFETRAPVRTLTVYNINGTPNVLAAYTCTPLVKFPLSDLQPGTKVKGTTVAELGNRNKPLDMIVYNKDGKDYLLMANNNRGVMKVDIAAIGASAPVTERIADKAGLSYESLADLKGVEQLDRLDKTRAVLLVRSEAGNASLKTIQLP